MLCGHSNSLYYTTKWINHCYLHFTLHSRSTFMLFQKLLNGGTHISADYEDLCPLLSSQFFWRIKNCFDWCHWNRDLILQIMVEKCAGWSIFFLRDMLQGNISVSIETQTRLNSTLSQLKALLMVTCYYELKFQPYH